MTASALRLRSVLYVPGSNQRALDRARSLPADALILDLEDAVAPEAKAQARDRVCELVRVGAYAGRPVTVRINGAGTPWHEEDLAAVTAAGPTAVLVPKVQTAQGVVAVEDGLRSAAADRTEIWAMLETPLAILRALEIATATERLQVLVVGTNDLLAELHGAELSGRRPLETSLALCLLAARASGRLILDGVHNDIADMTGFEAECLAAHQLGFDGKTLIHPDQIDVCNRVFTPSEEAVQHARRVIEAFEHARVAGAGVATVDGRLVEQLHVEAARRILAIAPRPPAST